nr:deoxyribose-phosphate aldolase isoform X5 [Anser cygnoides]
MAARNPGTKLELGWISKVYVNQPAVVRHAEQIQKWRTVKGNWQAAWLLKAVTCIDLTTLSGDDTPSNVHRMCFKAKHPIREDLLKAMDMHDKGLYEEIRQCREACGEAHMKTILATGELGSLANVYKASMIAMMAGHLCVTVKMMVAMRGSESAALWSPALQCTSTRFYAVLCLPSSVTPSFCQLCSVVCSDFIKTSTGKEVENATLPVGVVMMRAIKEFYWQTGSKVGFKPAGGIRTAKEAITWLMLVKDELGVEWLKPELFRLGASSLLEDIEKQIFHHVTGSYALQHDLAMA